MAVPNPSATRVGSRGRVFQYTTPHGSDPPVLPGKASRRPRLSRKPRREAAEVTPTPYQGLRSTAQRMLTMCCTGAHLLPKAGKEKTLPTTATAHRMPARVSLRTLVLFILVTPRNSSGRNGMRQRRSPEELGTSESICLRCLAEIYAP